MPELNSDFAEKAKNVLGLGPEDKLEDGGVLDFDDDPETVRKMYDQLKKDLGVTIKNSRGGFKIIDFTGKQHLVIILAEPQGPAGYKIFYNVDSKIDNSLPKKGEYEDLINVSPDELGGDIRGSAVDVKGREQIVRSAWSMIQQKNDEDRGGDKRVEDLRSSV
ncbi:MAG: hypothetical protein ABH832_00975 [bacterium]